MSGFAPLAEVTRGTIVESMHAGAVAVVNAKGQLLYHAGDPNFLTFTRSTLKPFQAVPLVAGGGLEKFALSPAQTALLCASHSGEPRHVAAVQAMLEKIGCDESHLRCGCHAPIWQDPADTRPRAYNQLHNNCSGKHAGFLAYCVQHSHPLDTYLEFSHPLQQAVRASVAVFSGVEESKLVAGIDGCSAPNYAMPLAHLAYAYARLAQREHCAPYGDALARLFDAMTAQPAMVCGAGRFDLAVMQTAPGDWVAKGGAEAVQAIGIRSAGLGIAIKVADGNARALYPAAVAVLSQLGLLENVETSPLASWARTALHNLRGLQTGEVRAALQLQAA